MTGYTVHTGASKKFVSGWDKVFGGKSESAAAGKKSAKATSAKKADGKKLAKGKKKK
jgi:hypothetical protein